MQSFRLYIKDKKIQHITVPHKNQDRFPVIMCGMSSGQDGIHQTKESLRRLLALKFNSVLFLTAGTAADNVREIYFMEIDRLIVESAYNNRV